MKINFHIVALI